MTGGSPVDRPLTAVVQAALVVFAVVCGVAAIVSGGSRSIWWSAAASVAAGWSVALVVYAQASVLLGRIVGILTVLALLIASRWWSWRWWSAILAAALLVAIIALIRLRWRGGRSVDAMGKDRTLMPVASDDGNRFVDALDHIWGSTRDGGPRCGMRAVHGHGSLLAGEWVGTDHPLCVPMFSAGRGGAVTARFSNFNGGRLRDDRRRSPHGLALRLESRDRRDAMDIVAIDMERFPVATQENFISLTRYFPKPPIGRYTGFAWMALTGRTSFRALVGMLQKPATSYAERTYHGLNSFLAGETKTPVRYRIEPRSGPHQGRAVVDRSSRFGLEDELRSRLEADGTVTFELQLVIGHGRFGRQLSRWRVVNPLRKWPRRCDRAALCTITLQGLHADPQLDPGFDPLDLPEGLTPSDDEILFARRAAYPPSFLRRRSAVGRPT